MQTYGGYEESMNIPLKQYSSLSLVSMWSVVYCQVGFQTCLKMCCSAGLRLCDRPLCVTHFSVLESIINGISCGICMHLEYRQSWKCAYFFSPSTLKTWHQFIMVNVPMTSHNIPQDNTLRKFFLRRRAESDRRAESKHRPLFFGNFYLMSPEYP